MRKLFFFIFTLLLVVVLRNPTPIFAQTCECKNVTGSFGVGLSCEVDASMNKCASGTTARCLGTINTCSSAGCSCISNSDPTPTTITGCYDDTIINFTNACKNAGYTTMCPGYGINNIPAKCCSPGKCPAPPPTPSYKCVYGDPLHFSGCPPFIPGNTGPNAIDYSTYTFQCPGSSPKCCTSSAGCPSVQQQSSGDVCDTLPPPQKEACKNCMGTGEKVWTAIGCITASPTGLIESVLPLGIGIAGGITFLLILVGSLQIMMSAGNPEKLNAGKELVTAAITGLLLIIFSIFLLRFIGVNILRIPGFD